MKKNKSNNKWFEHGKPMGWHKQSSQAVRRSNALHAHKNDLLATARALNQLANITTDTETRRKSKSDAKYFFERYKRIGKSKIKVK